LPYVLKGELILPGDKSISHRALMLLGISKGSATISNLSSGKDVYSTLSCMRTLGCTIEPTSENRFFVTGVSRFQSPDQPLDCGNSGTTIRLLGGLIAGANIVATLTGDESLQKRPMKRIIEPLSQMGARIKALGQNHCAPLQISHTPEGVHEICYHLPMASAQVKSAILLAGLFAPREDSIVVDEPIPSRDHTERMLEALGVGVRREKSLIYLLGRQPDMEAQDILVPGDVSSAAFWLVGAAILPGSSVRIRQVGINPLRTGILELLRDVGVDIQVKNAGQSAGEPYGDLLVQASLLQGNINITPDMVPSVIDEIPILTIIGLFTDGVFTLRGAEELRYKESDRLGSLIELLKIFRIDFETYEDGFSFQGNPNWQVPKIDAPLKTYHDHRLVMALEILNLKAASPLEIEGKEWAAISYPTFYQTLEQLITNPAIS
jgi:3-phosphoshikimate 1-carboxyvinyltransferase